VGAVLVVGVGCSVSYIVGGFIAHLIVWCFRGKDASLEATMQCIGYSQGMLAFTFVPLLGLVLFIPAQLFAVVQCTRMLACAHKIDLAPAALASVIIPCLLIAAYMWFAAVFLFAWL